MNAIFQVIQKSLADSREKVVTQCFAIWSQLNGIFSFFLVLYKSLSVAKGITPRPQGMPRLISLAIPVLLTKFGDISPRTRKAATDFAVALLKQFPPDTSSGTKSGSNDYSVWRDYLAPIDVKKGEKTPPKIIAGRLEMLTVAVQAFQAEGKKLPLDVPFLFSFACLFED